MTADNPALRETTHEWRPTMLAQGLGECTCGNYGPNYITQAAWQAHVAALRETRPAPTLLALLEDLCDRPDRNLNGRARELANEALEVLRGSAQPETRSAQLVETPHPILGIGPCDCNSITCPDCADEED